MGFFENWKAFRSRAEELRLPPACQAAFYAIIGKFNDAGWVESIDFKDSELQRLTQIRSSKTLSDAKSRLKLAGLVDYTSSKYYGTNYKLVQLASTSWNGKEQGTNQTTRQTTNQSKVQGKEQGKEPLHNIPCISVSKRQEEKEEEERARAATATDYCSEELRHSWIQNAGFNPNDGLCMKLGALEQTYSTAKVKAAIEEANARSDGVINFNFVQSVLMRMLNGTLTKGAMTNEPTKNYRNADTRKSPYADL